MDMDFIHKYPYSNLHELNLDWIINQTKDLMTKTAYLEEEFSKIVVVTEEHIQEMIDNAIALNNIQLAADLQAMYDRITLEYQGYVQGRINQLTTYIDNQDVYYNGLAEGYAAQAQANANAYTDNKILNYTMMINPITGEYDDVRVVVEDIVMYFHSENSLTAGEYDALDMTAEDYDNKQLTAYDYDFNGKIRLP